MGWGGQHGHMRTGIGWRTDGYDTNTPSINVYIDFYVASVGWGYNDDQVLYYGGSRSGSFSYRMSSPTGGSVEKYVGTAVIAGQGQNYGGGPVYSALCTVTGAYDGSSPSHSEEFALPARPPNVPIQPSMTVDSVGTNTARVVVYGSPDHRGSGVDWYGAWITSNNAAPGSGGVVVASAAGGTFVANNLNAVTTYYAWSQAHNGVGYSAITGPVVFTTGGNPPSAVGTVTPSAQHANGFSLSWAAPANGGSAITYYQVQISDRADMSVILSSQNVTVTNFAFINAVASTKYYFRVRAWNGVGDGNWSPIGNTNTQLPVPVIVTPTQDQVVSTGNASVRLTAEGMRTGRLMRVQWSQDASFGSGVIELTHSPAYQDTRYDLIHPTAYLGNGTWFIRARSESTELTQTTAWTATRTIRQSHAPVSTTGTPTGGIFRVWSATVPFVFTATDAAPIDAITAYQIVVERNDTGALVLDTGKVVQAIPLGTPQSIPLAISSTYKDTQLRWKVRVWDRADVAGSYSTPSIFWLVDLPAVAVTAPGPTVDVGSPTITWTFSASAGRLQQRADLKIVQNDTGSVVWEDFTTINDQRSMTPMVTVLQNNKSYTVTVTVKDTQGLSNSATTGFTSSYDPPDIIYYDVSSPDINTLGYVVIDWSNAIPDPMLVAWRVYRKKTDESTWQLAAEFPNQTDTQYKDFLVESHKDYIYNVTQVANRFGETIESPVGMVLKGVVAPVRTNRIFNPANTAGGTMWGWNSGGIVTGTTDGPLGPFATSARMTRLTAGAARFSIRADYLPNTTYTVRLNFKASERFNPVQVHLRPDVNAATNQSQFTSTLDIPAGESEAVLTVTTTATAAGASSGLTFITSAGGVGATLDIVATMEEGSSVPNHFSGAVNPDAVNFATAWASGVATGPSTLTEVPYKGEDRVLEIDLESYWLVVPGVPDLSVRLLGLKDDQSSLQFETSTYNIIGRGRHRDYGDRLGYSGTLVIQVRSTEVQSAMRLKIEEMREAQETYWLRTPYGRLFPVALGDIGWSPLAGVGLSEMGELTIPYEEVA